jgi:hypothetical protein
MEAIDAPAAALHQRGEQDAGELGGEQDRGGLPAKDAQHPRDARRRSGG